MSANYLFKPYKASDYINFAEETAKWIKENENVTDNGKRWIQSPDSDEDFTNYPMLTEKCLYGGSAGVGLFYLKLFQLTKKEEYLNDAKAALDDIIATHEGTEFYEKNLTPPEEGTDKLVHVKNMPGWSIGIFNGPTGYGYFSLKLYEVTGDKKYKDYAVRIAEDLLATAKTTPEGIHWSDQVDWCGDGGFVTFLLPIYELTGDARFLEAATKLGDYILSKGAEAPRGGKYWNVVDLSIIDFPDDVFWVNFAHGTSGVGFIFTVLYSVTKEQRFLDAAKAAAEYIENIAVGDDDAVLVPYLDSLERGPSTEFYYLSTCHGPVGTSLVFKELYKITKEQKYLDFVVKLSRGIIKAGAPENYSRGYWPSQSICCGTPGLLEHFVTVYKLTGNEEFLTYAKRTAKCVIGNSYVGDKPGDIYKEQNTRKWLGNWWRTIPSEVHSYTGLYIGSAGNAWVLLTLAALEQDIETVQLVEYNNYN